MRHAGTPPSSATHFGSGKVATKRNMRVDRHSGQELTLASRNQLKKGGRGGANWGRPGDELVEDVLSSADPAYDSCDELFESAFGRPRGGHVNYDWAGAHVSESDSSDMVRRPSHHPPPSARPGPPLAFTHRCVVYPCV